MREPRADPSPALLACSGVAVVIPTRDRPQFLDGALRALAVGLRERDAVLVVDSASQTSEVAAVAARHGATVLRLEQPGASRARNAGWAAIEAPLVAFTDDDCRPHAGWTASLEEAFADAGTAFVYGRVEAAAGAGVPVSLLLDPDAALVDASTPISHFGHGANMAFRREVLQALGGFDEVLGAGAPLRASEDKDALWRALRSGFLGRYAPAATVAHLPRPSRGDAVATAYSYGIGEGAFAAKRVRCGVPEGARGWRDALADASRDARSRYWTGLAVDAARLAGWSLGYRRGRRWPLSEDRFVP